MTFRKEDHQALQSMYHFKIKVDPAFAWGVPELVREIKPEEMNVPIRNKADCVPMKTPALPLPPSRPAARSGEAGTAVRWGSADAHYSVG